MIPNRPISPPPTVIYHSKPDEANGVEFMVKYSTTKKKPFIIESHACPYTEEITPMWMGSETGEDVEIRQDDVQYSLMCHLEDSLDAHHAYMSPTILYVINYKIGITMSTPRQDRSVLEKLLFAQDQLLCIHTTMSHILPHTKASVDSAQVCPNIHFIVAYDAHHDIQLDDLVIQINSPNIHYLDSADISNTSLSKYRDIYALFHNTYTQFTMPTDIVVTNPSQRIREKLLSIISTYDIACTVYTHTVDRPACHSIMGIT